MPIAPSILPAAAAAPAPASPGPPPNPDLRRWTISGTVHDDDERFGLGEVTVQLVDRFEPRSTTTDAAGRYVFNGVAESGVRMAFSRAGYRELTIEQVLPVEHLTIDVTLRRQCSPRPAPIVLTYSLSGSTVLFTWPQASDAVEYRLSVGMWEYVSPVFSQDTTGTSYEWANAPSGTYLARVQARNACGYGHAGNELKVIVP